jgi:sarcosine oxidase subunit alpha
MRFRFDGRQYTGLRGDTLASALLANGVRIVGRSFKLHRPRGVFGAGAEEPNAIVEVGAGPRRTPNLKATEVELYDGLVARSVNSWPSARFDLVAATGWFSRFLPAGFYYKTFMWPGWRWFEGAIRGMAGLGKAPLVADPDRYESRHHHCDVLVVGAGPAGLGAALAASASGARVVLAEQGNDLGGSLRWQRSDIEGAPAPAWVEQARAQLTARPEVLVLTRTTAFGAYDHGFVGLVERVIDHLGTAAPTWLPRERLWNVRAASVVLATGAIERPLVFPQNDRPGVMLAGAVREYLNRFAVRPGRRAVVLTNNDSAYQTAFDLFDAEVAIEAIVDVRQRAGGAETHGATRRGIPVLHGHAAIGTRGRGGIRAIQIAELAADGSGLAAKRAYLRCDLVCSSGGWSPAVHLFSQSRGTLRYDAARACFVPDVAGQAVRCVGAANGHFSLGECLEEGYAAGLAAASADAGSGSPPDTNQPANANHAPSTTKLPDAEPITAMWRTPTQGSRGSRAAHRKQWVDLQNDVTDQDIALAYREGMHSIEHVKRYTTSEMAIDQGKTSGINTLGILAELQGRDIASIGTTRFRPPYTPVTFGALAGRDLGEFYRPRLQLPTRRRHREAGADFDDYGGWQRPRAYRRDGETEPQAIAREIRLVRTAVGLFDNSPLGKFDVAGRDAAHFLTRIYANAVARLKPGRCRYGVMLAEDGHLLDDGVVARIAADHFFLTTTSANAAQIWTWLEEWRQCEWPELDVLVTPQTGQWANLTIAGPRARDTLQQLAPNLDCSNEALPFMSFRTTRIVGVEARVFRVGYSGELSYEINIPRTYADALWSSLNAAGSQFGLAPYGLEAGLQMRMEKGYPHVGTDTDATTTPVDLGMAGLFARKQEDFIGRRSLLRPHLAGPDREQLVGLEVADERGIPVGALLIEPGERRPPLRAEGRVTSACRSTTLQRPIALALLRRGRERMGEEVRAWSKGRWFTGRVVAPAFYDPAGERLNG